MNTARNIIITLTLASIGLSGAAQAAERDGRKGMRGDGVRVEQRADRRASREDVGSRRQDRGDRYARTDHRQDRGDRYARVDRRQDRQHARIVQGRRSGELTRGESRRLQKQQRKINRMERRFSSDGHLSGKERHRLERAQDRASRRIASYKHNDRNRGSGHRYARSYKRGHGYSNQRY